MSLGQRTGRSRLWWRHSTSSWTPEKKEEVLRKRLKQSCRVMAGKHVKTAATEDPDSLALAWSEIWEESSGTGSDDDEATSQGTTQPPDSGLAGKRNAATCGQQLG